MAETDLPLTAAVIVAAGRGTRAGGEIPKQWQRIAGQRVIDWTLDAFRAVPEIRRIVAVLHPDDQDRIRDADVICVQGGHTRAASVRAGLEALADQDVSRVLIHDAARACVTPWMIAHLSRILNEAPAAAPGLLLTDALWRGGPNVMSAEPRAGLFRAQTPQAFDFETILAAHRQVSDENAADDVEIARRAGHNVRIEPGEPDNIKITTAADFARAERILRGRMTPDIRIGNGFDVHRFGPGDHVMLCGVKIDHDQGLEGHSDADVGLHTVTDAIYGALAEGDIGRHFPPSDPRWKGADSRVFLDHAVGLFEARGYRVGNTDLTFLCERPKIGPVAAEMTQVLATLLKVAPDQVSVKATTTERLGFTGRGEGIAAMATITLIRP
ncbi:MAG: bifunctional 2-C-methyl-D-erythritol 4-phosphate cytidylyltransferase/2-C-methyl-D-erythritol 2,4-cyclodiphosphate synthase [Pseudomonadota bacterium]